MCFGMKTSFETFSRLFKTVAMVYHFDVSISKMLNLKVRTLKNQASLFRQIFELPHELYKILFYLTTSEI